MRALRPLQRAGTLLQRTSYACPLASPLAFRPLGTLAAGHARHTALAASQLQLLRGFRSRSAEDGLSGLSIGELKKLLSERGVDYRDCLEKNDLMARLKASSTDDQPGAPHPAPDSLTESELRTVSTFQRVAPSVAFIQTFVQSFDSPLALRPTDIPSGAGSGFVWDNNGHVVTNYHVIQSALQRPAHGQPPKKIKVSLHGSSEAIEAQVVGVEPEKDLAVLKMLPKDGSALPPPIAVGASDGLSVGQAVLAIGNPFGLDHTLTTGVVSALGREVDGVGGRPIKDCIQTDAGGQCWCCRGRGPVAEHRLWVSLVWVSLVWVPLVTTRVALMSTHAPPSTRTHRATAPPPPPSHSRCT